jgi:hypothetical protein
MLHRQQHPQTLDSHTAIVGLAASFARLAAQAGELMLDYDSRFDFVAMLPPWATASKGSHDTTCE